MSEQRTSIDEEIQRTRRKIRYVRLYIGWTAFPVIVVVAICAFLAALSPKLFLRFYPYFAAFGIFGVVSAQAILSVAEQPVLWRLVGRALLMRLHVIRRPLPRIPMDRNPTVGRADEFQHHVVRLFIGFPAAVILLAFPVIQISHGLIDGSLGVPRYRLAIVIFGFILLTAFHGSQLAGAGLLRKYRRSLDDELFRKNRAAGIQTGFYAAIVGIAIAYLTGIYDPTLGIAVLPVLCAAAVAAAGLRFVFLDLKAESDG